MQFFTLVEAILKLLKLWDSFLNYMDDKHRADIEAVKEARDKAVEDSKKAESDEEIWKSQDDIVNNIPKP